MKKYDARYVKRQTLLPFDLAEAMGQILPHFVEGDVEVMLADVKGCPVSIGYQDVPLDVRDEKATMYYVPLRKPSHKGEDVASGRADVTHLSLDVRVRAHKGWFWSKLVVEASSKDSE